MKGITPIMATAILILVTVGLLVVAFMVLQDFFNGMMTEHEQPSQTESVCESYNDEFYFTVWMTRPIGPGQVIIVAPYKDDFYPHGDVVYKNLTIIRAWRESLCLSETKERWGDSILTEFVNCSFDLPNGTVSIVHTYALERTGEEYNGNSFVKFTYDVYFHWCAKYKEPD